MALSATINFLDQYWQLAFDILLTLTVGFIFLRFRKIEGQLKRLSDSVAEFEQLAERQLLIFLKQSETPCVVPEIAETDSSTRSSSQMALRELGNQPLLHPAVVPENPIAIESEHEEANGR